MEQPKHDPEPIFIRELGKDNPRSGIAVLSRTELSLTLHAFEELTKTDPDQETAYLTEAGEILTLHGFFSSFPGYRQGSGAIVYHEVLRANTFVIGPKPWREDDLLRRCTFSVEGTDDQLHNNPRFDAILRAVAGEEPGLDVFSITCGDATLTVGYTMTSSRIFNRAPQLQPRFAVEFADGRAIQDARRMIRSVVRFLSASQCRELAAEDIRISRLTLKESYAKALEGTELPYNYALHVYNPDPPRELEYRFFARSFVYLREDQDMELFKVCLAQWVARDEEWDAAAELMLGSFRLSREISGTRLLAATRWLERIPANEAAASMGDNDFDQVVQAAVTRAEKLGHAGLGARIRGSLRSIKTETNRQRIERLVALATTVVDTLSFEPDALIAACMKARDFRGQAAHGRVALKSEREEVDFELAIYGTECLAYLLMLVGLPLTDEARRRVFDTELVRNFVTTWNMSGRGRE